MGQGSGHLEYLNIIMIRDKKKRRVEAAGVSRQQVSRVEVRNGGLVWIKNI